MRTIHRDKHGLVLMDGERKLMRFPLTKKGLAEAELYKKTWRRKRK